MKRQTLSQLQRAAAVALTLSLAFGPAWFAHAGQRPDPSTKTQQTVKRDSVAVTGSITSDEKDICPKVRKKLWTERDGWIVRQVTICD